jgi:hypothetical protein
MNELESQLDRLVDGELSHAEYVGLLSSLETEQEGWRKCALAFLEAQALRSELRGLLAEPTSPPVVEPASLPPAPVEPAAKPSAPMTKMWAQWGALAASLLLTFWLGRGSMPTPAETISRPPQPSPAPAPDLAKSSPRPPLDLSRQGRMTLVVDGANGQTHEVELPVVNGEHIDPQRFLAHPPQIPSDVVDAFHAAGHEIESHREIVPIDIAPGRRVLVPVDRVRVVPIRKPMF